MRYNGFTVYFLFYGHTEEYKMLNSIPVVCFLLRARNPAILNFC